MHAWSTIFTYRLEKARRGHGDLDWLERSFHKLLLNFTWWVNRKDRSGKNVFEGGFLGLDNIGVFDRSSPLPTGGYLEQADGTAWMALFCQNMLEIAAQLALEKPAYADMCVKFFEHYLWIASSMVHAGDDVGMWDEEDGFFYDVLRLPDGGGQRLKVRSMVGLLPLCAVTVFEGEVLAQYPEFVAAHAPVPRGAAGAHRPSSTIPTRQGQGGRRLASILDEGEAAARAGEDARRRGVPEPVRHPVPLPLPRRAPVHLQRRPAGIPRLISPGRIRLAACSAATPTGEARSGCRSTG